MKKVIFMIALCLASIGAMAQSTKVVNGAVVDKNGNPLPGAVVEATGGAESTVVDADGTYSIEVPLWLKSLTARYTGMKTQKKNIVGRELVFEMDRDIAYKWFVNLVGAYDCYDLEVGRIGVMAGYADIWGGYIKLLPTLSWADEGNGMPAITAGVIKRISRPVNLYLGFGGSPYVDDDGWGKDYELEYGVTMELGTIINLTDRLNMNVGFAYTTSEIDDFECYGFDIQVGFGVRF